MEEGGVVLMDLLWSDPTTNDGVEGVQPSPRGPGLVTFGPDRVKEFCKVSVFLVKCSIGHFCTLACMWASSQHTVILVAGSVEGSLTK